MKDQILKIAGVKDEASFYKKFPTREAFMAKHGGEFEKAQNGWKEKFKPAPVNLKDYDIDSNQIKIDKERKKAVKKSLNNREKAQTGIWKEEEEYKPAPLEMEEYDFIGNQRAINKDRRVNVRQSLNEGLGIIDKTGVGAYLSTAFQDIDTKNVLAKGVPVVGDLIQGFQMMKDQKKQLKKAQQWQGVSNVALQASQTRPEEEERRYVRPEDMTLTGEELFPIYGTGTNVLKHGGNVKGKKAQFGEIFSAANMTNFAQSGGGDLLSNIYRGIAGESGGGTIGGTIGGVAGGIIGGPVGKFVGQVGGEVIGELLDGTAEDIERAKKATNKNVSRIGINSGIQGLQRNNFSVMRTGGSMRENSSLDEDITPIWGGDAETISVNPYLPSGGETIMFRGQSHDDGGIGINFGGNPVEVEGGEPALKLKNGSTGNDNLVVYGNVKINNEFSNLLGDPDAKGKKFKTYVADLSGKEKTATKKLDSSMKELDGMEVITPYDKLKMSSMEANITGSNMTLKSIADKKINAAALQQAINQDAEEKKIKITDKGDVTKAKNGIILKYQGGGVIERFGKPTYDENGLEIFSNEAYEYFADLYRRGLAEGEGPISKQFQKEFSEYSPNRAKSVLVKYPLTNHGKRMNLSVDDVNQNIEGIFGYRTKEYKGEKARELSDLGVTPINPDYSGLPGNSDVISRFPETQYKRSALLDAASQILPFVRPSDAEDLDPRQLAGEMYALSNNQLQPVQAQRYTPQLDTPYNVSFQDILNENRVENQSAQRLYGYNPAAQSLLSAQGYQANQSVLGEQFRANQAMQDKVYSGNRATMNDAQLKNIALLDEQYKRQSQASSNTRAVGQAAVSSIADKYLQNQFENRALQAYENFHNYRSDERGRMINWNAPHQFEIPTVGTFDPYQEIDEQGNVITTTESTKVARDEFGKPKGSVYTAETKNKKSFRNGSIVKYIHEL